MEENKRCSVCGNKTGFGNSIILKDGKQLCGKCIKKAKFPKLNFKYHLYKKICEMNLEEIEFLIKSREENRKRLKSFESSKSFCGCVQMDEHQQEWLFIKDSLYRNKRRLYKKNPPVFGVEELIIAKPIYFLLEGKNRADIEYFVGTLHPFINGFGIKLKRNAKYLGENVCDEVEEMQQALKMMLRSKRSQTSYINNENREWFSKEKYVKKLQLGVKKGYFNKEDIVELLK